MEDSPWDPCRLPPQLGGLLPMKIIHCNVWGDIEIDALARAIIDTWPFQRLHHVRKIGMAYKVFPTATVSCFEQALGAYHLVRRFLKTLWRHQPQVFRNDIPYYLVPIAALCARLGTAPFSPMLDHVLSEMHNFSEWHLPESRGCLIVDHILTSMTFSIRIPTGLCLFLKTLLCPDRYHHPMVGEDMGWFRSIVHDPLRRIDVPLLDDLLRDCHALGMPCAFDVRRILANCRIIDRQLCFCDRIVDDIEGVVATHRRLVNGVYNHPKIIEYNHWVMSMIRRTVTGHGHFRDEMDRMLINPQLDIFLGWTDSYFLAQWIQYPIWRSIETRLFPSFPDDQIIDNSIMRDTDTTDTGPSQDHSMHGMRGMYGDYAHYAYYTHYANSIRPTALINDDYPILFYHRQRPDRAFHLDRPE